MATGKYLGKIANVSIGTGGYQDAMFGVSFSLSFDGGSSVSDFWGGWGPGIKHTASCKWTDAERLSSITDAFWKLANLMRDAKVIDAAKLAGVPIEVEVDGNLLKSWRVLKEVL